MIKTLIIMTTYGQIFYSKQTFLGAEAGDEDISLTAGLISAIYSMTSETQQQKITELELEDLRLVFRELPGEKLFIITVDKRMDIADADDLLGVMVEAFNKKYGDNIMDGLILNDFEPVADAIVADKLWYATTEKSIKPVDIGASILLFLTFLFYPTWLLSGDDLIINPIKESLNDGILQLIGISIVIGLMTAVPITLLIYILSRISKISQTFRFASEFLRRPTRGGYAEVLPSWFLIFPIAMCLLFGAVIYSGRGLQYGLTAQTFSPGFDNALTIEGNPEIFGIKIFWLYVFSYLVFYLATWFIFMPVLLGFITQNFNWTFIKSSWIIIGISMVGFIPAQIIAGITFQEALGFHPTDAGLFPKEAVSLEFLFKVLIPINLFLFVFIFLLGVGMSQIVAKNRNRYPVGFGIALFATLALQNFIFFFIFNSGTFFNPLFIQG